MFIRAITCIHDFPFGSRVGCGGRRSLLYITMAKITMAKITMAKIDALSDDYVRAQISGLDANLTLEAVLQRT